MKVPPQALLPDCDRSTTFAGIRRNYEGGSRELPALRAPRRWCGRLIGGGLLLGLVACGRAEAPATGGQVPMHDLTARAPDLVIEAAGTEPLYKVEASWARRGPEREPLVLNGGSAEVIEYDTAGKLRYRAGRSGSGPGEFQRMKMLGRLPGDTIAIFDQQLRRITLLCDSLRACGELDVNLEGSAVGLLGPDFVWQIDPMMTGWQLEPGLHQLPQPYIRMSRDGELLDTLAVVDGPPVLAVAGASGRTVALMSLPLARFPQLAASGGNVFALVDGHSPTVHLIDGAGPSTFALSITPIPMTDEDYTTGVAEIFGPRPGRQQPPLLARREKQLNAVEHPATYPPTRRLLVDAAARNLWVELENRDAETHEWIVTSLDGRESRRVRTPARFRLDAVDSGMLIGVWHDENDVEVVQVYNARHG